MTLECPADVLPDELGRTVFACTQRLDYPRRGRRVAQPHREVAQPALVADTPDRRAAQALVELRFGPGEQLHHACSVQTIPDLEILFCRQLCKAVPRASELAV